MAYTWRIQTPFFCGDADGKTTHAKTTALLGSLRWWYEALVRALDLYACDPTKAECEGPSRRQPDGQYCSACAVFGCTGWSKHVGLRLEGGQVQPGGFDLLRILPRSRRTGWFLGRGLIGDMSISLKNTEPLSPRKDLVKLALLIASKWGALGARTQHGYGVGKVFDSNNCELSIRREDIRPILQQIRDSGTIRNQPSNNQNWPDLKHFFFAKFPIHSSNENWISTFKRTSRFTAITRSSSPNGDLAFEQWIQSGSVPVSPNVRNELRNWCHILIRLLIRH